MTERKFKVGDRVVVKNSDYYKRHIGSVGTVVDTCMDTANVVIDGQDDGFDWHFTFSNLTHYGKTLAELNVKAGDVVSPTEVYTAPITIGKEYRMVGNDGFKNDNGNVYWPHMSKFRIVSRAEEWTICPANYTPQDNHDVTYHMGLPVSYRLADVPLVDVEKRVQLELGIHMDCMFYHDTNATLRGQTRNGKPVGQWVIDVDETHE